MSDRRYWPEGDERLRGSIFGYPIRQLDSSNRSKRSAHFHHCEASVRGDEDEDEQGIGCGVESDH